MTLNKITFLIIVLVLIIIGHLIYLYCHQSFKDFVISAAIILGGLAFVGLLIWITINLPD